MRVTTGIELGPEACVVVRVRGGGDRVELSAVRGLRGDDWDARRPLVENLAEARRTHRLPRAARVVAWGLPQSASSTDSANPLDSADQTARTLVSPLREAGFDVEAVLSPAQALAVLARRRPRPPGRGGAIWLALNRQGAAIAIVDGGDLLYAREFDWHYRPSATVKEELLQRYSLVAHLSPEVRHGLDIVRASRDVVIGSVVTCGDLPDLRSLTMPLIEELDIDVETLDTLEGLDVSRLDERDDLAERASALWLAAAVGASEPSSGAARLRPWLAAAAAVTLLVVSGWLLSRTLASPRTAASPGSSDASAPPAVAAAPVRPAVPAPTGPVSAGGGPAESEPTPAPPPRPVSALASERRQSPPPSPETSKPAATSGRQEAPVSVPQAGRPSADRVRPVAVVNRPLTAPIPQVNSILVAPDRRLAVVGGEIVREGDAVGPRVLVRIEPDAVVLREPSGHEVRVPIRRKLS